MSDGNGERSAVADEMSRFWQGANPGSLADLPVATAPALRRLGPSPFSGAGFPVLGFLETVYEQVASHGAGLVNQKA